MAIQGLLNVERLYTAQVNAGVPCRQVLDALVKVWNARLAGLQQLTDEDREELTNALGRGPWSVTDKTQLVTTIMNASDANATYTKHPRPGPAEDPGEGAA